MRFFALVLFLFIFAPTSFAQVKVTVETTVEEPEFELPSTATSFQANTLYGKVVKVGSSPWREKRLVVLHFWATWCPPCREEFAELVNFADANPDLDFIAVSIDKDGFTVVKFLRSINFFNKKHNIQILYDSKNSGRLVKIYNLSGIPNTFLINRNGEVIDGIDGGPTDWIRGREVKEKFRNFRKQKPKR